MIRIDTLFGGLPGMPGYNSLYFDGTGPTVASEVHDRVAGLWGTVASSLHEDLTYATLGEAVQINPSDGTVTEIFAVTPDTGGGSDPLDLLPSATQLCVNFRTATIRNNRRIRGKMFIPGLTEGNTDSTGAPLPSVITNFQAVVSVALIGDGAPAHVVWSRPSAPGATDGQAAPVTSYSAMPQWAVLRSRRP